MNDENDQTVADSALFDAVVTGAEIPEITQPNPAPAPEPSAPEPSTGTEPAPAMIPSSRLREEADARRAVQRELDDLRAQLARNTGQQPQPSAPTEPAKPKDFWEAPDQFTDERVRTALNPIQQSMIYNARLVANAVNGEDKVNAAMTAFDDLQKQGKLDPVERARVFNDPNPFHAAVEWHKRHSAITRVGNDPDAWLEAELEKRLSDPAQQAKILERIRGGAQPAADARPVTSMPPSLRNIGTAAAPSGTPEVPNDAELFASVTRRRR